MLDFTFDSSLIFYYFFKLLFMCEKIKKYFTIVHTEYTGICAKYLYMYKNTLLDGMQADKVLNVDR